MIILHLFQDHSFDAAATHVMGQAFDLACLALREFGGSDRVREIIAKQIVEVAKLGERDVDRLCEKALKAFAASAPSSRVAAQAEVTALQPLLRSRA